MTDEDRELLAAVRDWRPSAELHPIAMTAFRLYQQHGGGLPPSAIQRLRVALDGHADDLGALARAMEGLIRFMLYVGEERGDRDSSQQVAELLREYSGRFEPLLRRVAAALGSEGASRQAGSPDDAGHGEATRAPPGTHGRGGRPPAWMPRDQE
jgi:hypothetical protein